MDYFGRRQSKWNKIEHRLFNFITKNWPGRPPSPSAGIWQRYRASGYQEHRLLRAQVAIPVPGLVYRDEWLTPADEASLLAAGDAAPWITTTARTAAGWLSGVAGRLAGTDGMALPDQVIVNEYLPGQGIAPHADCAPCFGPVVAMVSLQSSVEMDFAAGRSTERVPVLLRPRSLLVLSGPARYEWRHGIAKRRSDPHFGLTRQRRVSLTFRTVIPPN